MPDDDPIISGQTIGNLEKIPLERVDDESLDELERRLGALLREVKAEIKRRVIGAA